jgi:hypothetical protein
MLISNCVANEDGSYDFDFHVDPKEAAFLMDHAIKDLIHHGVIQVNLQQAEQEFELHKEQGGAVQ